MSVAAEDTSKHTPARRISAYENPASKRLNTVKYRAIPVESGVSVVRFKATVARTIDEARGFKSHRLLEARLMGLLRGLDDARFCESGDCELHFARVEAVRKPIAVGIVSFANAEACVHAIASSRTDVWARSSTRLRGQSISHQTPRRQDRRP